jgi:hypothetical protein
LEVFDHEQYDKTLFLSHYCWYVVFAKKQPFFLQPFGLGKFHFASIVQPSRS